MKANQNNKKNSIEALDVCEVISVSVLAVCGTLLPVMELFRIPNVHLFPLVIECIIGFTCSKILVKIIKAIRKEWLNKK